MDFLNPVLGTTAGLETAGFSLILIFFLKVLLFCLPFILAGLLLESDVYRVTLTGKAVKFSILMLFLLPVMVFALFNYAAPGLSESFWESHKALEPLWIMEGSFAPVVLAGLCFIYIFLYAAEILRGDLRD